MKCQATERAAAMLAHFDTECAAIYAFDDDAVWKEATEAAQTRTSQSIRFTDRTQQCPSR